jgi:hypothetical protein
MNFKCQVLTSSRGNLLAKDPERLNVGKNPFLYVAFKFEQVMIPSG